MGGPPEGRAGLSPITIIDFPAHISILTSMRAAFMVKVLNGPPVP